MSSNRRGRGGSPTAFSRRGGVCRSGARASRRPLFGGRAVQRASFSAGETPGSGRCIAAYRNATPLESWPPCLHLHVPVNPHNPAPYLLSRAAGPTMAQGSRVFPTLRAGPIRETATVVAILCAMLLRSAVAAEQVPGGPPGPPGPPNEQSGVAGPVCGSIRRRGSSTSRCRCSG